MYCGLCNHKVGLVGDLKDHMVEDHKKCNVCKKYVTNEEDLRIHTEHNEFQWAIGVVACRGAINSSALWNQLVRTTSPSPISLTT